MKQEFDLAIVCAISPEKQALLSLLKNRKKIVHPDFIYYAGWTGKSRPLKTCLVQSGLGGEQARESLEEFRNCCEAKHFLVTGLCGALSPEHAVGTVLNSTRILSLDGGKPFEGLRLNSKSLDMISDAVLLTSSIPLLTSEEKEEAYQQTGADAVDMESYFLAETIFAQQSGFSVLRVVSDDAKTSIDPRLLDLLHPDGNPYYTEVIKLLLKSPGLLIAMMKMRQRTGLALRRLVSVLSKIDLAELFPEQDFKRESARPTD